jgi:hypothetical protein
LRFERRGLHGIRHGRATVPRASGAVLAFIGQALHLVQ